MNGNSRFAPASKKAYEIAYALCRVSAKIDENSFAGFLTKNAIELLGFVAGEDYRQATKIIAGIEYLLKFGADMNYLSITNADAILLETANLKHFIAGSDFEEKRQEKEIDASQFFSFELPEIDKGHIVENPAPKNIFSNANITFEKDLNRDMAMKRISDFLPEHFSRSVETTDQGNSRNMGSAVRQSAILDAVRQSGNCRLKDLQNILPDISERTIRYDLESLVGQNLIRRIGGGAATYYAPAA